MTLTDAFADFIGGVTYADIDGARVWDVGRGRPLVLLHGVAGSRRPFFRVVPRLAERYRVLVPELRGERAPAPASYETLIADLRALFDSLALDDVTLVGVSFGGALALAFAAEGDPRLARVAVQGTFAHFRLRRLDRATLLASHLFPAWLGARYFARRVRRGAEVRHLAQHAPGLETLLPEWSARTPFATLRSRTKLIGRVDLGPRLNCIRVPVTLAHGAADKVVPRAFFERLRRLLPDADAHLWEDVAHNAALTHPERFASLVEG